MKPIHEHPIRYVLVTGCSSGIGWACAHDLAAKGCHVFAGVRKSEDASRLDESASAYAGRLTSVLIDIDQPDSVYACTEMVGQTLRNSLSGESGLHALVNNAGILLPGPLELMDTSDMRRQFETNVMGTHRVTKAFLPLLRQPADPHLRPRLVFVSSISGRITPPFYGAYSASKHALGAMAAAWRMELAASGILVSVVEPDSVITPIWEKAVGSISGLDATEALKEVYGERLRKVRKAEHANRKVGLSPLKVAYCIRRAVLARHPKLYYQVGWRTRIAFLANIFVPARWMDLALRKAVGA